MTVGPIFQVTKDTTITLGCVISIVAGFYWLGGDRAMVMTRLDAIELRLYKVENATEVISASATSMDASVKRLVVSHESHIREPGHVAMLQMSSKYAQQLEDINRRLGMIEGKIIRSADGGGDGRR